MKVRSRHVVEPLSAKHRFKILHRDSFTCKYCGRKPPEVKLCVDHIVPVGRGGTNDDGNLCASCSDCNHGKGISMVERHEQAKPRKRVMRGNKLALQVPADAVETLDKSARLCGRSPSNALRCAITMFSECMNLTHTHGKLAMNFFAMWGYRWPIMVIQHVVNEEIINALTTGRPKRTISIPAGMLKAMH